MYVEQVIQNLNDYVSKNFFHDGKKLRLTTYQAKLVEAVLKRVERIVWVANTRSGKSLATAVAGLLSAILYRNEEVVIVSPTLRQSKQVVGYITEFIVNNRYYRMLVQNMKADEIRFRNGSVIRCLSVGNPSMVLGFGATILIIDEAEEIDDEIFRTRLIRMLATKKDKSNVLVAIGTAHTNNFLRSLAESENAFVLKTTWKEAYEEGLLNDAQIEYMRKTMTEREWLMWMESQFLEDGVEVLFKEYDVRRCMKWSHRILSQKETRGGKIVVAADIARYGDDESACVVLEMIGNDFYTAKFKMLNFQTRRRSDLVGVANWIGNIISNYSVDAVGIDAVGLGAGVVDILRKVGVNVFEISLSGTERTRAYLDLSQIIAEERIELIKDDEMLKQFLSFRVETKNGGVVIKKQEGVRDDIVDALVYATYLAKVLTVGEVEVADFLLRWG